MSAAKKLEELEAENRKLKQLLADAHLDNAALKELLSKTWYGPLHAAEPWTTWSGSDVESAAGLPSSLSD